MEIELRLFFVRRGHGGIDLRHNLADDIDFKLDGDDSLFPNEFEKGGLVTDVVELDDEGLDACVGQGHGSHLEANQIFIRFVSESSKTVRVLGEDDCPLIRTPQGW